VVEAVAPAELEEQLVLEAEEAAEFGEEEQALPIKTVDWVQLIKQLRQTE
jgi:hypothetical protein